MAQVGSTYGTDFHAWTHRQAGLLREGRFAEADVENIAEEIASMGRIERRELMSRLEVELMHLLKWQFQPAFREGSWQLTIQKQRRTLSRYLDDIPSLQATLDGSIADTAMRRWPPNRRPVSTRVSFRPDVRFDGPHFRRWVCPTEVAHTA